MSAALPVAVVLVFVREQAGFDVGPGTPERFGDLQLDARLAAFEKPNGRTDERMQRGRAPENLPAQRGGLATAVALEFPGVVEQFAEGVDPLLRTVIFVETVDGKPRTAKRFRCCLCGCEWQGVGNNPEPVDTMDKRCCDPCNVTLVIPARMGALRDYIKKRHQVRK